MRPPPRLARTAANNIWRRRSCLDEDPKRTLYIPLFTWTRYRRDQLTERPRQLDAPSCKGPASRHWPGCLSELSTQSARVITINKARGDPLEVNTAHVTDNTSADESFEEEVVLSWRSARRKRSTPVCHLCDHEITGVGSESERHNLH